VPEHWPLTWLWVLATITAPWTPAPMQRPTLTSFSTKSPACFTRVAGVVHCTVVQGEGAPATTKGQPAMVKVSVARSTVASAVALVAPGLPVTVPPWGHIRVLAVVMSAGIRSP
jgi:hypothetical protein